MIFKVCTEQFNTKWSNKWSVAGYKNEWKDVSLKKPLFQFLFKTKDEETRSTSMK